MHKLMLKEIEIIPIKAQNGLVAFASCIVNNQLYLGNVAIYSSPLTPEGFRLVYPTKTLSNGQRLSIVHPITREVGSLIQRQIIEEYLRLMKNLTEGDTIDGPDQGTP